MTEYYDELETRDPAKREAQHLAALPKQIALAKSTEGYEKLFRKQKKYYDPPKKIAKNIVEAMEAQGYEIDVDQALAYMKSSYAVHAFDLKTLSKILKNYDMLYPLLY